MGSPKDETGELQKPRRLLKLLYQHLPSLRKVRISPRGRRQQCREKRVLDLELDTQAQVLVCSSEKRSTVFPASFYSQKKRHPWEVPDKTLKREEALLWFECIPQNSCVGNLIPNAAVLGGCPLPCYDATGRSSPDIAP
ncbi:uncharacterized protein LOC144576761 [Callithrix jacchus]